MLRARARSAANPATGASASRAGDGRRRSAARARPAARRPRRRRAPRVPEKTVSVDVTDGPTADARWPHSPTRRDRLSGLSGSRQRRSELRRAGEPVGRQLLQRRVSTASSTVAGPSPPRVDRRRLLGHHLRDDRLGGRAGERRLAGAASRRARSRARRRRPARRSRARPSPARASCTAACRATSRSRSSGLPPALLAASAMPKSATSALPSCSRMFSGLMSRWMTPCRCA